MRNECAYEERMMFVDFSDTPISREDGDESIRLESIPDLLPKKRILPELSRDDHPRPGKQFVRRLCASCIGIPKLFSIR